MDASRPWHVPHRPARSTLRGPPSAVRAVGVPSATHGRQSHPFGEQPQQGVGAGAGRGFERRRVYAGDGGQVSRNSAQGPSATRSHVTSYDDVPAWKLRQSYKASKTHSSGAVTTPATPARSRRQGHRRRAPFRPSAIIARIVTFQLIFMFLLVVGFVFIGGVVLHNRQARRVDLVLRPSRYEWGTRSWRRLRTHVCFVYSIALLMDGKNDQEHSEDARLRTDYSRASCCGNGVWSRSVIVTLVAHACGIGYHGCICDDIFQEKI